MGSESRVHEQSEDIIRRFTAYGVHLLTASGAGLGLWAIILTMDGYFQEALWVLAATVFIDSIDGTLARSVQIKQNAPGISGEMLDNLVDYVTWTVAPLFWAYATLDIPAWPLLICAVASMLNFANIQAKTSDNFFTGFPSYWNIVVLYLYLLQIDPVISVLILLFFALVSLLPVRFVYPTQTPQFRSLTLFLGALFALQLLALIVLFDQSPALLLYSSFLFPFYYFGLSFYLNLTQR